MFEPSYSGCSRFTQRGWIYFFPDRRGGGLSEGKPPNYSEMNASVAAAVKRIREESTDVLAGLVYLKSLDFADLTRVAIMGRSAGTDATLYSASVSPAAFRAVVLQATAIVPAEPVLALYADWAKTVTVPILIQHGQNDRLVPVSIPTRLVYALQAMGKDVAFLTYKGGHDLFGPEPEGEWGDDYLNFLARYLSP